MNNPNDILLCQLPDSIATLLRLGSTMQLGRKANGEFVASISVEFGIMSAESESPEGAVIELERLIQRHV